MKVSAFPLPQTPHQFLPNNFVQSSVTTDLSKQRHTKKLTLKTCWAKHLDEVREAQRLRYSVFVSEMGASIPLVIAGHDIDIFDNYCEHLLVKNLEDEQVIGTYRLLTPAQSILVGKLYSDNEFDLTRLNHLRPHMVELGRSCVHKDFRTGSAMLALWSGLVNFMQQNRLEYMVGCASIPMNTQNGKTDPMQANNAAASIWQKLRNSQFMADSEFQVTPHLPLPVEKSEYQPDIEPPALIKSYLRLGARILGAPAWDPEFNTADLPLLMNIGDLPCRYRKHFTG
ncbi:MAG: GNAT family N-acyltransferase [Nitrosomonas sp.]|nr:GNAT family N-acyltransferase [Nitrosomonas sp.]